MFSCKILGLQNLIALLLLKRMTLQLPGANEMKDLTSYKISKQYLFCLSSANHIVVHPLVDVMNLLDIRSLRSLITD